MPTIAVTGASRGIGLAVTRILLQEFHANVIAISRTVTPELQDLASDRLLVFNCDVTNEQALTDVIRRGAQTYKGLDGLILNAGILDPTCRVGDDTPLSAWKAHFDVNFFSLVTAVKAALPSLRQSPAGGKIIFVSSGAAAKGIAGWGPYGAGKAAMNSLCRTLADEEPDVTSIAVRPGMVDTAMQKIIRESDTPHMKEETQKMFVNIHAQGNLVKPEDCGHVIAALSINAPKELSGEFVSWDSEECKAFRKK